MITALSNRIHDLIDKMNLSSYHQREISETMDSPFNRDFFVAVAKVTGNTELKKLVATYLIIL